MFGLTQLKIALFISALANTVISLECVPRPAGELIENSGFETDEDIWITRGTAVATAPTYPSHSGSRSLAMSASYVNSAGAEPVNIDSFVQQFVGSAYTARRYRVKAYYNVIRFTKGETCPNANLPLASCKLTISYVDQIMADIHLSTTNGYVEFSSPFTPETGGRYFHFRLSCKPPSPNPAPQCADIVLLLDDVSFYDLGHDCWNPLGCYTDSPSNRVLPYHGHLPNWPHTTTIESCQEACNAQGYSYAGLEYGAECWCGNALVNTSPASSGCSMPCSGHPQQICGGPDRLNVYQKP